MRCRRTTRQRNSLAAAIAACLLATQAVAPARAGQDGARGPDAVTIQIVFTVRNVNRTKVVCPTDGGTYPVRGHLIAPPRDHTSDSVTLYLHGATAGEWMWHFTAVADYDYATEMAKLGHASVVIDRLGYGSSGHPPGSMVCVGSQADVADQIIEQLRTGAYSSDGGPSRRFSHVALAGQSAGAYTTEVVGYSFPGAADAIVVMGWVDQYATSTRFTTRHGPEVVINAVPKCLQGGERAQDGDPSSPTGYAHALTRGEEVHNTLYNVEPRVVAAFTPLINRDPCGEFEAEGAMVIANNLLIQTISIPVMVVVGDHDLFSVQDAYLQTKRYVSSKDVTLKVIPDSGHTSMLERNARLFRAGMSSWLFAHGF